MQEVKVKIESGHSPHHYRCCPSLSFRFSPLPTRADEDSKEEEEEREEEDEDETTRPEESSHSGKETQRGRVRDSIRELENY